MGALTARLRSSRCRIGLAGGDHERGAVQGAGPGQQLPLFDLARAGSPGGRDADDLRALLGQLGVEAGKPHVVAGGQADLASPTVIITGSVPAATVSDSRKPKASNRWILS